MNRQTIPCNARQIEAFLDDRLSESEQAALIGHLDHCMACREQIGKLAADPETWSAADSFLTDEAFDSVRLGTSELSKTGNRLRATTGPVVDSRDASIEPTSAHQIEDLLRILSPTDDPRMLGRLGSYEISGVVGAGRMGVVLKGYDPALARIYLAKGVAIHKFITGPHDLTPDQTELFDEVVKRGDETLLTASPETKGKGIVAVIHLTGVLSNRAETGNADPLVAQQLHQPTKLGGATQSKVSANSVFASSDAIDVSSKFTAAEDRVAELAEKLRKLEGAETEVARDLRKQLTEAVTAAFMLRQQLHQTQIDVQRAKLDALERRVARRSETAQQIINQRVTEVLKAAGILAGAEKAKSAQSGDKRLDGNVSIDYESETDIVTVRGNKTDVERTLNVIEQIKQQSTKGANKP